MHPNQAFRKTTRQANIEFLRQRSFGVLSINAEPAPLLSHIPFQLAADGATLQAHLVRSNPIARQLRDKPCAAVLAVSGADAYISPDWYQLDNQVPTWNYVAVHARGMLRLLDSSHLHEVLTRLSNDMETRLLPKTPWSMQKLDASVYSTLAKQIVPVAMDITGIEGTWKLAQNKPAAARLAASAALARGGIGLDTATLAQLMQDATD